MICDGPLREPAPIAQIAEVVSVAPDLIRELWVPNRRAGHIFVDSVTVLSQLAGEVSQVVQHLQQPERKGRLGEQGSATYVP